MKWRFQEKIPKPRPNQGDYRTRLVFAVLPTKMNDRTWVWLEKYKSYESYRQEWVLYDSRWTKGKWIVVGRTQL